MEEGMVAGWMEAAVMAASRVVGREVVKVV
jgi:hypothetical protein